MDFDEAMLCAPSKSSQAGFQSTTFFTKSHFKLITISYSYCELCGLCELCENASLNGRDLQLQGEISHKVHKGHKAHKEDFL
jgi:hypothetical protein